MLPSVRSSIKSQSTASCRELNKSSILVGDAGDAGDAGDVGEAGDTAVAAAVMAATAIATSLWRKSPLFWSMRSTTSGVKNRNNASRRCSSAKDGLAGSMPGLLGAGVWSSSTMMRCAAGHTTSVPTDLASSAAASAIDLPLRSMAVACSSEYRGTGSMRSSMAASSSAMLLLRRAAVQPATEYRSASNTTQAGSCASGPRGCSNSATTARPATPYAVAWPAPPIMVDCA